MSHWTLTGLSAAAIFSLAACTSAPATSNAPIASTPAQAAMATSSANQTLQAFHWDLEKATDSAGKPLSTFTALAPKTVLRLGFTADAQSGQQRIHTKVCNNMGGSYQLEGNKITIGQMMGTMMACSEPGLMELERSVGAVLPTAQTVLIDNSNTATPRAVLQFKDGSQWQLVGKPTDATRYGGAGETIFMEVGPQLKPCTHGVMRNAQCLQVREIRYDTAGRKTVASDWQHFYGSIDGYQHEAGIRNVLRLKRYTVQNPPADASRYAYVLDMTVESAREK